MRRILCPLVVLTVLFACVGAAHAGQFGSRAMTGWFNVRTDDGWTGRRYMDGEEIVAEEFDSNRDDRIDVWRFYRRGILSSEERDQNHDGKVDFVAHWDSRAGTLISAMRDTHFRGVYDVELEYVSRNRWEVREDRNFDGITDRIIYATGPSDMFERMGVNPANQIDIASTVPRENWTEVWADDAFTGNITDYFRYNRGVLTHHGDWDGRRVAWRRVPPDYVQPRPIPATPPALQDENQLARRDPEAFAPPPPGPPPVRDPFDVTADGLDPYAGIGPRSPESSPVWDDYAAGTGRVPTTPRDPAPAYGGLGYAGGTLPRDESSARAVPARMRPPGQSAPSGARNPRR